MVQTVTRYWFVLAIIGIVLVVGAAVLVRSAWADGALAANSVPAGEPHGLWSSDAIGTGIAKALDSDEHFSTLSVDQQGKLIRRTAALMAVRDSGTCDDYIELIHSWGGIFPYDAEYSDNPEVLAEGERLRSGWIGSDHDHGVAERSIDKATIRIVDSGVPNAVNRRPSLVESASVTAITNFVFDDHVRRLAASGAMAAEVSVPVRLRNGVEQTHAIVMLWSEQESEWLPYMLVKEQEKQDSERIPFYLDFF